MSQLCSARAEHVPDELYNNQNLSGTQANCFKLLMKISQLSNTKIYPQINFISVIFKEVIIFLNIYILHKLYSIVSAIKSLMLLESTLAEVRFKDCNTSLSTRGISAILAQRSMCLEENLKANGEFHSYLLLSCLKLA